MNVCCDVGIAFEQGRTLVTPETVPFRLTRDIVDGMGVSGIEGVFRRSATYLHLLDGYCSDLLLRSNMVDYACVMAVRS